MTEGKCASKCRLTSFMTSSLGKKFTVGAAGFLLGGFLVVHLAGNLFLFVGEGAFNHYAETLSNNPLLPAAEIALAALFLAHIVFALKVRFENAKARPVAYEVYEAKGGRTIGSKSMAVSGVLVLAFLIIHLKTFRFGDDKDGLYKLVMEWFKNPFYSGFYVLALAGLGLHLSHGFQSGFQTFGLNHPRYTPLIKKAGLVFAALIFLGFASMPIYFGFLRAP
ncbi:MAG: succinate dehydrogenase cytochrome b subunit [Elusimicrobia bacterium]|nr:succinate dehydrogenase cytochrome b subunit [Elusimicrobiota bacterium]